MSSFFLSLWKTSWNDFLFKFWIVLTEAPVKTLSIVVLFRHQDQKKFRKNAETSRCVRCVVSTVRSVLRSLWWNFEKNYFKTTGWTSSIPSKSQLRNINLLEVISSQNTLVWISCILKLKNQTCQKVKTTSSFLKTPNDVLWKLPVDVHSSTNQVTIVQIKRNVHEFFFACRFLNWNHIDWNWQKLL